MPASSNKLSSPQSPPRHRLSHVVSRIAPARLQPPAHSTQSIDGQPQIHLPSIHALQERRCRRRAAVLPMYSAAQIRLISTRQHPMDAHIYDISETGMAIEVDSLLPVGTAVTVEFHIAGLGRVAHDHWSELSAAAQVVRHDNLDDFPAGPYKIALRFIRISTMTQAQLARFIATQPG